MKGELLSDFMRFASYSQIQAFIRMQKEYGKMVNRYINEDNYDRSKLDEYLKSMQLFLILGCGATIVKNKIKNAAR